MNLQPSFCLVVLHRITKKYISSLVSLEMFLLAPGSHYNKEKMTVNSEIQLGRCSRPLGKEIDPFLIIYWDVVISSLGFHILVMIINLSFLEQNHIECETVVQGLSNSSPHACPSMVSASFQMLRLLGLTSHSPGYPILTSFQDFSFLIGATVPL